MKYIKLLSFAALFSTTAWAAPETYTIDSSHTLPRFSYSHFGYSNQLSRFDKTSGKIVLDRQAKTGTIEVTIDTTSVNTGYPLFNEHIQGEDFLATAKYPTATFSSNKLNFDGETLVSVEGVLNLKGISKPVTLTVTSFQCMPHPMLKKRPAVPMRRRLLNVPILIWANMHRMSAMRLLLPYRSKQLKNSEGLSDYARNYF